MAKVIIFVSNLLNKIDMKNQIHHTKQVLVGSMPVSKGLKVMAVAAQQFKLNPLKTSKQKNDYKTCLRIITNSIINN